MAVNTTALKNALGNKFNSKATITQLNAKADTTYVNTQLATKAPKPILVTSDPTNPALYDEGAIIFVKE